MTDRPFTDANSQVLHLESTTTTMRNRAISIRLPEEVLSIIRILERHGFEAYAVGGCVRDSILGRKPEDWDITTNALPVQAKDIFHKTIDTGIAHGTITVRMHGKSFELTTYRIDGKYSDGRHPDAVAFVPDLKEDLRRRDFTINAMAYHPDRGLVDLFGGREDLENKTIRCVGDPVERFSEDALRMLRCLRFSAQLDFKIEEQTAQAAKTLHKNIRLVSAERIRTELEKLLLSDHPGRLRLAANWGLTGSFFPEWDAMLSTPQNTPHHNMDVGRHTLEVIKALPKDKRLRLAGLLHDVAKPITRKTDGKGVDHFVGHPFIGEAMAVAILRRLKYDNETIRTVSKLVLFHDERLASNERNARRLACRIGAGWMDSLLALKRADLAGQSDYRHDIKLAQLEALEQDFDRIRTRGDPLTIAELALGGKDLIELGIAPSPAVGELLGVLLEVVIDDPQINTPEQLRNIMMRGSKGILYPKGQNPLAYSLKRGDCF